jgi:hypothetical protein
VLVVAALLAAAVLELPGVVVDAADAVRAGRPAALERAAAPADGLGIPNDMVERVREVIPEDAHYAIVLGPSIPLDANQTVGIPQFLRYWLLPRTFEDEADDADWVIAYGQSSETLGIPVKLEIPLAALVNAVEVDR